MAQNQPSSAIAVINSDTINIPEPGIITSGTNTSGAATTLVDAGQDFLNPATNLNGYNIKGGDVVIGAAGAICEIESVDQTDTGQTVTLKNIPDSSFIPVQVQKVFASGTTCSDIIGLQ